MGGEGQKVFELGWDLYLKFTWMSGRGDRLLESDEADSKLLTVLKLSWDSKLRATSNDRDRS